MKQVKDLRLNDLVYIPEYRRIIAWHVKKLELSDEQVVIVFEEDSYHFFTSNPEDTVIKSSTPLFVNLEDAQQKQEELRKELTLTRYKAYMDAKRLYEDSIELLSSPLTQESELTYIV